MLNSEVISKLGSSNISKELNHLLTTYTSMERLGDVLLNPKNVALKNEFIDCLVNRIALTIVNKKIALNPLAELKKGRIPFGSDIQEVIANPSISKEYTFSSEDLLKVEKCDVKAQYYSAERKAKYPLTISDTELSRAVINEGGLQDLIQMMVGTLYAGDNIEEFELMKHLPVRAYLDGKIKKVIVKESEGFTDNAPETTIATIEDSKGAMYALLKALKTYTLNFGIASSKYNAYAHVDEGKTVKTFTELKDQCIIMRSDIYVNIDLDVLAGLFNVSKGELANKIYIIDEFDGTDIYCVLCDYAFIKVYDMLYKMSEPFYNPDTLTLKYVLHHQQKFGYSTFANAIAFVSSKDKQLNPGA